ncbi:unnamed protein product, partial [Pylaiella littoralis]
MMLPYFHAGRGSRTSTDESPPLQTSSTSSTMRARDIGVSVVAAAAALLALQGTPDLDIQLRWMVGERPLSREGNLPVPLPLVTDLDGDGEMEVVVLTDGGMTIQVLSVPVASGETLVNPWILHEEKLAPLSQDSDEKRAVAMAAGYLDAPITSRDYTTSTNNDGRQQQRPRQTQRIVVVRKDWSVVCFDHTLKRLWAKDLKHKGSPIGKAALSFVIDQVAITVTHSVRKLDDRGHPKGGTAEGLVIVGASMRHRDGHFHHSRAGHDHDRHGAAAGEDDPLGVHVEAFVEGEEDSRDSIEEEVMSEEEKTRKAAQHGGGSHHIGTRSKNSAERNTRHQMTENANLDFDLDYPGFGGESFYDETPGAATPFEGLAAAAGAAGGGGGRRYRRSLLHHLPHYWSAPSDTRLEVTALHRNGPGDGSGSSHADGGGGRSGGLGAVERRSRSGPGKRRSLP